MTADRNWLTSLLCTGRTASGVNRKTRLRLETLEAWEVPAVYTWAGASGGNWSAAGNWTVGGQVPAQAPGAGDTVKFTANDTDDSNADIAVVTGIVVEAGYTGAITLATDVRAKSNVSVAGGTLAAGASRSSFR